MTHCWFHQLINMRQWIDILGAGLVQIDEVHAHPTFAISLLDHHHISQPVRVINIPDKFAIISFWTSSLMALSHSGANTLFFWHTGLEEGYTFRQCVMTLRSIPGMSSWLHENTSMLFFKNWTRSCFASHACSHLCILLRVTLIQRNVFQHFDGLCNNSPLLNAYSLNLLVHSQHGQITLSCC